jgi:hypothetical protein
MNILKKYIKEAVKDFDSRTNGPDFANQTQNQEEDDIEPDFFNQEQSDVLDLVDKISEKFRELPEEELEPHKEELKRLLMMLRSL